MAVTFKKRQEIYYRDGGKCQLCGKKLSLNSEDPNYIQMDHIKPRSQGGDNSSGNLRATCKPCNSMRGKYSGEVLKKKILKDIKQSDIDRRHKKKLLDDIENGFITESDLHEIDAEIIRIYETNTRCVKKLYAKLHGKEVERHG